MRPDVRPERGASGPVRITSVATEGKARVRDQRHTGIATTRGQSKSNTITPTTITRTYTRRRASRIFECDGAGRVPMESRCRSATVWRIYTGVSGDARYGRCTFRWCAHWRPIVSG